MVVSMVVSMVVTVIINCCICCNKLDDDVLLAGLTTYSEYHLLAC
jgi:hypothetical protein